MNKTVNISDINKEIAAEMQLQEMIDILSERISNLNEITEILSERIDIVNKRISNLITEE